MKTIILDTSKSTTMGVEVKNILLIDDEDCTIFSLQALLSGQGYNVTIARNGKLAVDAYKANPKSIDLILMDISEPISDGLDTHRELTQFDPDVLFLLMSSYSQEKLEGLENENFIRKPMYSSELFTSIINIFDTSMPAQIPC